MKTTFVALLLIVLPSLVHAAVPPASIQISTPNAQVKVGDEITLNVAMVNTSQTAFLITLPMVQLLRVDVTNVNGTPAPKTGEEEIENTTTSLSGLVERQIVPGAQYQEEFILTDLYDLSVPGTYLIRVYLDAYGQYQGTILSNLIRVTITQ